jgi:hypothetical protein
MKNTHKRALVMCNLYHMIKKCLKINKLNKRWIKRMCLRWFKSKWKILEKRKRKIKDLLIEIIIEHQHKYKERKYLINNQN